MAQDLESKIRTIIDTFGKCAEILPFSKQHEACFPEKKIFVRCFMEKTSNGTKKETYKINSFIVFHGMYQVYEFPGTTEINKNSEWYKAISEIAGDAEKKEDLGEYAL